MGRILSVDRPVVVGITMAIAAFCGAATAQSHPQRWTTNVVAGEFPSQSAALAAVRAQGGVYALAEVVEDVNQGSTSTTYIYGASPKDPTIGEWVYGPYTHMEAPSAPSEAAAMAGALSGLATRYPHCGFVSIEPKNEWAISTTWSNGMVNQEYRHYNIRDSNPTACSDNWHVNGYRSREIACPAGLSWSGTEKACIRHGIAKLTTIAIPCAPCELRHNPVSISTGGKYQAEKDFELPWLTFTRHYHSTHSIPGARLGPNWTHDLAIRGISGGAGLVQPHGGILPFRTVGPNQDAVDGSNWRIKDTAPGTYTLITPEATVTFNASGLATRIERLDGSAVTLEYDGFKRLVAAVSHTGLRVEFAYVDGVPAVAANIASISLGGVPLVAYRYDESGRLASVRYPDGTSRTYYYERPDFPNHLTGIGDESNVRYATFAYDANGYVTSSEHADGTYRGAFSYEADGSTLYTDASNQIRRYTFTTDDSYRKVSSSSDGSGTDTTTFAPPPTDFRRRPLSTTDKAGVTTSYSYLASDDPTLGNVVMTTTTEAVGTAAARTSVTWVESGGGRLVKRSAAGSEIIYMRNARGQVVSTRQADTLSGSVRTSYNTWCEQPDVDVGACPLVGLLVSTDGPRVDVPDVIRYQYYSSDASDCQLSPAPCAWRKGSLWKMTNAQGQVTETLRYDMAGRVLTTKDSNGVITNFEYDPRGRLIRRTTRGSD